MPRPLSPAECRSFLYNGYVQLPRLVPVSLIEAARTAIDVDLAADRSLGNMPKYLGDSFCPGLLTDPAILDLYLHSPVNEIVTDLFGPDATKPPDPQIAVRFPEYLDTAAGNPPHIDGFPSRYNTVTPGTVYRQNLLVGVYLSRIEQADMGNFVVWPGSHLNVAEAYRSFDAKQFLSGHEPPDLAKRLIPQNLGPGTQIVAEAGDVVLAHGGLIHSTASNLSLQLRHAVYFRIYLRSDDYKNPEPFGDATRFFERIVTRTGSR